MKVLVTGSAGFIAGYLVQELLSQGHSVVGVDNYSKYGPVEKSYQQHPGYTFVQGDAKNVGLLTELASDCDHFVAGAARIGGISYFHEYAYDLLAENERIVAASFDAGIAAARKGRLVKMTVLSSSMVFENATVFPTPESHLREAPPPTSTYGFQKLACEYFARGAFEQYGLPYTICRPFNCVGVGESRALGGKEIPSGNVKLAMSHVVPDLVQKVLKGQDPLRILGSGDQIRCYTYGGDLARGIVAAMFHSGGAQRGLQSLHATPPRPSESSPQLVWKKVHGNGPSAKPFRMESDPAVSARRRAAHPGNGQGSRGPGLRSVDEPLGDAGRGRSLDPAGDRRGAHLTGGVPAAAPRYSLVVPVYNEGANIASFCRAVKQAPPGFELLICYDFAGDNTLPALERLPPSEKPENLRLVLNTLGRGVRYAIEAGMRAAAAPVVVVSMADVSDDLSGLEAMVSRVEAGAAVVCASRYMPGGRQIGGPPSSSRS